MIVDATVPELGLSVTLALKVPPELSDNSKPVGAVTIKSVVRSVAPTLKLCSADTVPAQAVKVLRLPPLVMVGVEEIVVKATDSVLVPELPFNVYVIAAVAAEDALVRITV